ncbi:MAG: diadenylate cyclase CdaA [Anaerolineae bacterium]|nr:diadenylate cyclase CdaA [Anaerolineae bacterium]
MELIWTLQSLDLTDAIDILLIAAVLFGLSFLFRGTQAVPVMRGMIVIIVLMTFLSSVLNLVAFRWLTGAIFTGAVVAIPVIFQPEIRRGMERIGRAGFISRSRPSSEVEKLIEDVSTAAGKLSERRHGALIVLERTDPLDEFIETGIWLDGEISPLLLLTIFYPKTELHDGAVIIRHNRVISAAAVLPLSAAHGLAQRKVGTRHRAGIGISEISDAIVVIVSEETGQISVANGGRMIRRLDSMRLQTILRAFYTSEVDTEEKTLWGYWRDQVKNWRRSPSDKNKSSREQSSEAA